VVAVSLKKKEAPAAAAVADRDIAAENQEEEVEIGAPAATPVVDDTEALRVQIAALQAQLGALDAATAPVAPAAPARLPGTDEAARIAAEMAALKPPKA
jgi:hypothetical protein